MVSIDDTEDWLLCVHSTGAVAADAVVTDTQGNSAFLVTEEGMEHADHTVYLLASQADSTYRVLIDGQEVDVGIQ